MTNERATRAAAILDELNLHVHGGRFLRPYQKHHPVPLAVIEDALQQAQAAGLRWTKETPTKEGWYWWRGRESDHGEIVSVTCVRGVWAQGWVGIERTLPMSHLTGEWAGPIAEPTEARAGEVGKC